MHGRGPRRRGDWAAGYDVYVTVRDARTNGSTALVPWTVRLDLAQAPFPWVPDALGASGLVAGTTCADLPVLEVSGVTGWGDHHLLGPGAPVHEDVWLQAHRGDPAAPGTLLDCR